MSRFFQRIISDRNGDIGERIYDLVLEVDEKTLRIESKAWRPDQLSERLLASSLGGEIVEGAFKNKGPQLRKDLIDSIGKALNGNNGRIGLDAIDVQWRFDGRMTSVDIDNAIDDIMRPLNGSETTKQAFFKQLGHENFFTDGVIDNAKIQKFLVGEAGIGLRDILETILIPG